MTFGAVEYLDEFTLVRLPKGQGASEAIQHNGGTCPVDPLQPISVWWRSMNGQWWHAINTAAAHDWSRPCIYRTRTPHRGHPMLAEARRERAQAHSPVVVTPLETIAMDFTRLVDAIENYLSRCN